MIHDTRAIANEGEAIELDPFAFWPDRASRLVGLGGAEPGDYPDYVFHTLYVSCGTGPILFTVRLVGLKAQRGTLILRVHELPEVMGAHARQIALSQTQLSDLVRGDGTVMLPATAKIGYHYAILGFIYGDTIATADDLTVQVARRSPGPEDIAMPTRFRAPASRVAEVRQIVGEREGTLVTPVSQPCTARQVKEAIFAGMLSQLANVDDAPLIDRWEWAYLARTLDRYDVARSGAQGLGIGALDDPLAPWLIQHGCSLLLTTADEPPSSCDLPTGIQVRRVDPRAIDDLAGFDFAWATRRGGIGGDDRQAVLKFVEDVLRCLKPGGLFAVVLPIDVAPRPIGEDDGVMLRRSDIDRIALLLLSRGHQVAQLCPWGDAVAEADDAETVMISAFGLIVRRTN